jgi:UPF0271 protein
MKSIDLNADMGELPVLVSNGTQEALLQQVTSANISCGGHAGDDATIQTTIAQAVRAGVAIGAHPGYEDPEHFGRRELSLGPGDIVALIHRQLTHLGQMVTKAGARIAFVKPHGALYNQAVTDRTIARAIAEGVMMWRGDVVLVGLAGPAGEAMLEEFREAGAITAAEAFADRRYEPDGRLLSRGFDEALIRDPAEAANQSLRIAKGEGVEALGGVIVPMEAETICLHSDTPGAVQIAEAVLHTLAAEGIRVRPFSA